LGAGDTGCNYRPVDVTAELVAPCEPRVLFELVADLGTYPDWLDIVARAVPAGPGDGGSGDDGVAAWSVDLRGQLGPLARSKRLRMVRTVCDAPREVRFERQEHDGRQHSPWTLTATVTAEGTTSTLRMHLHYGGRLAGPVVERLLAEEIERSAPRLTALVASPG
jgi:hypothetical protein